MKRGSRKAIVAALLANLGIAIAKFAAWLFTGAASMLAEAVRSVADTGNQALLLLGGARASRAATLEHPLGYGRERYFRAFVVALVPFSLGSLFALWEGIEKLLRPQDLVSPEWAVGVLAVAIALEAGTDVRRVIHTKTLHLGPEELLVGAKLELDSALSFAALADAIDAAERRARAGTPSARVIYLERDVWRAARAGAGELRWANRTAHGDRAETEAVRVAHALVIGGGIAGLGVALALSRDGHRVTVLEKDATPLPETAVEAFEHWDRRGAPQVRHSHAFLARLRNLLRDRAPDLLEALLSGGAYELRITEMLPPSMDDRSPKPGDEDLVLLGCRRTTFEWVMRRVVAATPGVEFRDGVDVLGLAAQPSGVAGVPRVVGVLARLGNGATESLRADVVIDASGRRSSLGRWLAQIGAAPIEDESEDCGIFYSSRFYRLRPGAEEPPRDGPIGADLGYMKFAVFSGDSRIFSVTLAASPEDDPMRAVLKPGPFEAAAKAIPTVARWIEPDRSEPVTDVYGMAGLRNRRKSLIRAGRPVALGVHAIGDALIHSNPLYGRGCTLALVHAYLLADALREHGDDAEAVALALADGTKREIEPWYRAALMQDRDAREVAAAARRGEDPSAALPSSDPSKPVDPKAFLRSVLRDGLLPALRTDAVVVRAFLRNFNLLDTPDSLLANGDVMDRVLRAWREREQRAPEAPLGPGRAEMVRVLERVAA